MVLEKIIVNSLETGKIFIDIPDSVLENEDIVIRTVYYPHYPEDTSSLEVDSVTAWSLLSKEVIIEAIQEQEDNLSNYLGDVAQRKLTAPNLEETLINSGYSPVT